MQVRLLIPMKLVRHFDAEGFEADPVTGKKYDHVPIGGSWTEYEGPAGTILDHPDSWKLCLLRELVRTHPHFGKRYAEPFDDEAKAIVAPRNEAIRRQLSDLRAMNLHPQQVERLPLPVQAAHAEAMATAEAP